MAPDAPSTSKTTRAAAPNGVPAPPTGDSGSKAYQPAAVQPRIWAKWEQSGAFHADPKRVLSGEKKPYCILIPPPNVTGALHLGHALNNTLQDILTRAHRLMGFETLWMPGTDHAGIATQAVVERRLRKEGKLKGPLRTAMTRDQFVAQVQTWKDEYERTITNQLKAMGCSCDYARQRFTMDDICARAVREAFFRLFKDGLIYRGKRLVNWDPVLQTAVADDECYDAEVDSSFWYLRYPLCRTAATSPQRSEGSKNEHRPVTWDELARLGYPGAEQHRAEERAWVTVATTRPETYLGDTAVAVNPHDPRAKALRGLHAELPLVGRIIPIVEDSYVVLPAALARTDEEREDPKAAFATGFLKVTPAHDTNDAELGQRHHLAAINMMSPDGRVSDQHGWTDIGDAHIFVGKTMANARTLVVREFETRGLLEATKPYRHSIKHSDRSKAVIEPYLSDQWYVKVTDDRLAGAANRALAPEQRSGTGILPVARSTDSRHGQDARATDAGDGSMHFHPARYAKMYEQWHDNIRDWCISRQLWWGHRIPVWTRTTGFDGFPEGTLLEIREHARTRKPYSFPPNAKIKLEVDDTVVFYDIDEPKRQVKTYVCFKNDKRSSIADFERNGYEQDPDVLDTWFSSALWPLSTMGWPEPDQSAQTKDLLPAFNPTSVLSTAREIITLWVSRMVMMNRYFHPLPEGGGRGKGGGVVGSSHTSNASGNPSPSPFPQGRGAAPFRDVFIHAVVQDGDGKKMSKTAGNGVDPLDIIETHGADAMRFTLAQMATNTQDVRMPVRKDSKTGKNTSEKFDAGRNFCNKLWNASRFAIGMLQKGGALTSPPAHLPTSPLSLTDRWLLSRLARAVRACESSLKSYEFADYGQTLYQLLWWDFCDWYLEAIKPTVESDAAQRAILRAALDTIIRLLHPVTPFITEAIHEQLRPLPAPAVNGITLESTDLLCTSSWPKLADSLIDEPAEKQFTQLQELINAIRNVRSEHQVAPKRRITLHCSDAAAKRISAAAPGLVEHLAGLEAISTSRPTALHAAFRAGDWGEEMHLSNLADAGATIDAGAEQDRLTKQLADLRKSEAALAGRLSNPGYTDKAPPKLVEESRAQLAKIRDEIAAVEAKLKS